MQNSKISPGVIPRTLVLGESKVFFWKYTESLVLQQCKIQQNFLGYYKAFFIILTKGPQLPS